MGIKKIFFESMATSMKPFCIISMIGTKEKL